VRLPALLSLCGGALVLNGCTGQMVGPDGTTPVGNGVRAVGPMFGPIGTVAGQGLGALIDAIWPHVATGGAYLLARRGSKKRHKRAAEAEVQRDFTQEENAAIDARAKEMVRKELAALAAVATLTAKPSA
jgi:hypothetical protein